MEPRIVVLGGTGAVGAPLVTALRRAHQDREVVTVGRSRGEVRADLGAEPAALASLARGAAAVVNATGLEDPRLAAASPAPFLDISASTPYLLALALAPGPGGVVVNVGLAPGLTSLLAREVSAGPTDEVDVAIVLGVGEHHGPAAREWTARLLRRSFPSAVDGRSVRSFTEPATFDVPGRGRRRLPRADFPDGAFPEVVGARVRSYLGLTSRAATLALRAATYAPRLLGPALAAPVPGSSDFSVTAVSRSSGATSSAWGRLQSLATAELTALTLARLLEREAAGAGSRGGVTHLLDLVTLADVAASTGVTYSPKKIRSTTTRALRAVRR